MDSFASEGTPFASAGTVLPLIVLIVLVIFLGWMAYLLLSSGFQSTGPGKRVETDRRADTIFRCLPGQCATNIVSGFKTCPEGDEAIFVNPLEEVCNSRTLCDNPLTPFAVQSDGSTNFYGVCEGTVACPCVKTLQCPNYVLSAFTVSNGNAYANLSGQRLVFPQVSSYSDTSNSSSFGVNDLPPLKYNDLNTFCSAPLSWLPLSSPGCNFVSGIESMTYNELLICMGQAIGCLGLAGSPCLQGVLAMLTDDPSSITRDSIKNAQFACVRGTTCPCGQLTVFDTELGATTCVNI